MNLELSGKFISLLPIETGQGKNGTWTKQAFIVETEEQYPKKICMSAWNENAKIIQAIKPFSTVKVGLSIESREWNGRWYTDVRALRIEPLAGVETVMNERSSVMNPTPAADPLQAEVQADDDLPF